MSLEAWYTEVQRRKTVLKRKIRFAYWKGYAAEVDRLLDEWIELDEKLARAYETLRGAPKEEEHGERVRLREQRSGGSGGLQINP